MKKRLLILFAAIFMLANLIGYLGNIDVLKTYAIWENGFTFSFVTTSVGLSVALIYYLLNRNKNK